MGMARMRFCKLSVLGVLWVGFWVAAPNASATGQPVTLHYVERPPYTMASGVGLTGLTGGPSYQAFKAAKVPVEIRKTPFARQLHYLEINSGMDCMIGMFKKPERERFAKYSKPIYQDQPQMILTTVAKANRFAAHASVVDVFNDKKLVLLVKLGYSYGLALDALVDKYQPTRQTTTDENLDMLRQVKFGMADYMLMAPEEANVAIEAAGLVPKDFRQIKFKNMPGGEYRHLLCSNNVPDEVMHKLNAAIRFNR